MGEPEELSDGDLLRLSANGRDSAFAALYRRHQGPVFRFALHMSGRTEIAEEVTQEVFLTLIVDPERYSPERGPLEAFLIGVARNKIRRRSMREQLSVSDLDEREFSASGRFGSPPDPFDSCSKKSEARALRAAILSLPPRYREVIVLCDLEEMQYVEVARVLGCAIGTVRSRLHRARNLVAAKLRSAERCSV